MRYLAAILLLSTIALAENPSHCLIVSQPNAFGWTYNSTRRMHYVAGDFPTGMKWKSNLSDSDIRKIREAGTEVVIVPPKYTAADVEEAKKTCANPPHSPPPSAETPPADTRK